MVAGNLKAKSRKRRYIESGYRKPSRHLETNNNGQRVIDFGRSKSMIIASTCFPHEDIHKITWTSPGGNTSNWRDQALIETGGASNILDVRSYRGANYDSYRYLARIKYKGRIITTINRNNTSRHKCKLQTNRLKDPAVKNELQKKTERNPTVTC
jgi:hypothetical protein